MKTQRSEATRKGTQIFGPLIALASIGGEMIAYDGVVGGALETARQEAIRKG